MKDYDHYSDFDMFEDDDEFLADTGDYNIDEICEGDDGVAEFGWEDMDDEFENGDD